MIEQIENLLEQALKTKASELCLIYSMSVSDEKVAESIKDSIIEKHRNYLFLMKNYKKQ